MGGTISLLTRPLDHLPPSQTTVEIEPKGLRVVRGAPVTIRAATAGALPATLDLMTWTATDEGGQPIGVEKVPMENLGAGKFSAKVARLEKTLRYRAVTGPFTSPTYTAEAVDPVPDDVRSTDFEEDSAFAPLGEISGVRLPPAHTFLLGAALRRRTTGQTPEACG